MASLQTHISELATALGAMGVDLGEALADPPPQLIGVPHQVMLELRDAHTLGEHSDLFAASWRNGRAFLVAEEGLRGRLPIRVEWRGPAKPVGREPVPADLRIDHVFLVSVKARSNVLHNLSPSSLFDGGPGGGRHWYGAVAPTELQALYEATSAHVGARGLPPSVGDLLNADVSRLTEGLPDRRWPSELLAPYRALCQTVSAASAERWNGRLSDRAARELQLWSLLRLAPTPYYLLGASKSDVLRIRVDTPWDWRQRWRFLGLDIEPDLRAGQPQVRWRGRVRAARGHLDQERVVEGIVEVRWSHGRFCGAPEAKVQLRTRHEDVPGYNELL